MAEASESGTPAAAEASEKALKAFEAALSFLPAETDDGTVPATAGTRAGRDEAILHLRAASIHYKRAEESEFEELEAMSKAQEHLKFSLLASPTAEAWSNAGLCAYQRALAVRRQQGDSDQPQALFREALRYLAEANVR